jgi:hypothetical protein
MPAAECIGFVWRRKDAGAGSSLQDLSSARVVKLNIRNLIT